MDKKIFIFLGFVAGAIVLILIDISVPSLILAPGWKFLLLMIAFFFDGIAYASRYYSYLFGPLVRQRKRNIVLSNEDAYWLASSSDAILHKRGEDFIATVYVKIPLYRSATEMTEEEKLDFTKQISRLVSLSREPVRFTSQLHVMNKDNYIRSLRSTISSVENEEARLVTSGTAKETEIERVRGQASMWHHMLDNVAGTTSFELVNYAAVSALGSKEFEAISAAQQRGRELISGISALFGVTPSIVTGELLLRFVEPEYLIPYSTVSEQISKSIREQVT